MAEEVRYYLTLDPRQLPSHLLYDALGSSLFDAICHLPWYGVTRAELGLLAEHAPAIGRVLRTPARIVELGCGSGDKLATLAEGLGLPEVDVDLIDVSPAALGRSRQALGSNAGVRIRAHEATYEAGLLALPGPPAGVRTLVAFLGSNIGNFDPPGASAWVRLIRSTLLPGDCLLIGADLVKPEPELLLAYDDPLGLTAAFNKNLHALRGDRRLSRPRLP
jgi:uncharacterized SAM-dependent methyltransferase